MELSELKSRGASHIPDFGCHLCLLDVARSNDRESSSSSPIDFNTFQSVVDVVETFWFSVVKLRIETAKISPCS